MRRAPYQFSLRSLLAITGVVAILSTTPHFSKHLPEFLQVTVAIVAVVSSIAGACALLSIAVLCCLLPVRGESSWQRAEQIRRRLVIAAGSVLAQAPLLSFMFSRAS